MTKSLTAILMILAATTVSAQNAPQMALQPALASAEAALAPTFRRPRANGSIGAQPDATDARPRRPRAGGTIVLESGVDTPQQRRARANGSVVDHAVSPVIVEIAVVASAD
jgi:hypothetical protein